VFARSYSRDSHAKKSCRNPVCSKRLNNIGVRGKSRTHIGREFRTGRLPTAKLREPYSSVDEAVRSLISEAVDLGSWIVDSRLLIQVRQLGARFMQTEHQHTEVYGSKAMSHKFTCRKETAVCRT